MLVDPDGLGLRSLSRNQLDELLSPAECTIVSELSNEHFHSYVLSESSLFVYPYKIILKTCGTTKLLKSIPVILNLAVGLHLEVSSCRYTRGSYIFPQEQQSPQGSFHEEVSYLNKYFGHLKSGGKAYVLEGAKDHKWHIYVASSYPGTADTSIYTLEMCMTELHRGKAAKFYKSSCDTAKEMTNTSGIGAILPKSQICDFMFDPCGYSMNGIEGTSLSTIHVTPEDGFSYASFECMGYDSETVDLPALIDRVLSCFKPAVFSVAIYASGSVKKRLGSWESTFCPNGYVCDGTIKEALPGESTVVYHTFTSGSGHAGHVSPISLADGVYVDYDGKGFPRCGGYDGRLNAWQIIDKEDYELKD
ncbi:hypothetical protein KP509_07G058600 [Ceratopteris richardii]|nr:hypothetical protein KP509_07G058600 [Ceratopteris richardii]